MVWDFLLYPLCHISFKGQPEGTGGNMWEMEGDYGKGMGNEGKGEEIGCKQIGNWRTTLEN